MPWVRVALCQLNTVVGDLNGNVERVLSAYRQAEAARCDIAAFPELTLTGYPPEDLLLKPGFVFDQRDALDQVAKATGTCAAVVGFVDHALDLHNAAAVCAGGAVQGVYHKRHLPNYAVFDEARYFTPGDVSDPLELFEIAGVKVGVSICEDAWTPSGPIVDQAAGGAELIVNINSSPYFAGRLERREAMLATRAADASCALVYVNQIGGQDELVFDGASMVFDAEGALVARARQFTEEVLVVDLDVRAVFRKRLLDPRGRVPTPPLPLVTIGDPTPRLDRPRDPIAPTIAPALGEVSEVYEALVLGTRDYIQKNGFRDVVFGLSGGIDSALVACIATEAIGPQRVHAVLMPSRYSSEGSVADAHALCQALGIDDRTIPIERAHAAFLDMLSPAFDGAAPPGLTEENLQSRIRGVLLMALSNAFGWLVLTTGNKSEVAVGYSTLYGDTAGGFAVIKDVPKTVVFRLARYVNERAGRAIVPEAILTKPPSAELRPDQTDDQSLPPYEVLDPILQDYVEDDFTIAELEAAGFDGNLVRRIARLVDLAEYKRRQSPPGVRVSAKAFGKDRRLPITNGYRG